MKKERSVEGPYIRWLDYGYDGWKPDSYDSIKELLEDQNTVYGNTYVITKIANFEIVENDA